VDFYQVWVQYVEDFSESLLECLTLSWPDIDRESGAHFEVTWLPLLSSEILGAAEYAPQLSGAVVSHPSRVLSEGAHDRLISMEGGPVHRGAEAFVADPAVARLSKRMGGALVLAFRDSPAMAYAATFREGRCDWSYYLAPGGRVARCDGSSVYLGEEAKAVQPDGDRIDLLVLGLEKFSGGHWQLSDHLRMVLPELLSEGS
jgi:hypothetical protein